MIHFKSKKLSDSKSLQDYHNCVRGQHRDTNNALRSRQNIGMDKSIFLIECKRDNNCYLNCTLILCNIITHQ